MNRVSEAGLQFELVLCTNNKLASALLPQRRCLSMPARLDHRKGAGDDSIPSRKSLIDGQVSAVVRAALLATAQDNDIFSVIHLLNNY